MRHFGPRRGARQARPWRDTCRTWRLWMLAAALLGWSAGVVPSAAQDAELLVIPTEITDLKAVFGRVESYEVVPARARIGGTVIELAVAAGSAVTAGDVLAIVSDDKLALEMEAVDARAKALEAQLENARIEHERGKTLLARGIIAQGRFDQLATALEVTTNQLQAVRAERAVITQRASEGEVLAPRDGRVLSVPVTRGSVVMPGEQVAHVAAGGYFLRLALPERHAALIREGDSVSVGPRGLEPAGGAAPASARTGRIAKVYPQLDNGRVVADVEVDGLGDFFVGERALVWLPVARRSAIVVPAAALVTRNGIDYVRVATAAGPAEVTVIPGAAQQTPAGEGIEILSGLEAGDRVLLP